MGGGGLPLLLRCTATVLIHPWGGGSEPKILCTKNCPNQYFLREIYCFPLQIMDLGGGSPPRAACGCQLLQYIPEIRVRSQCRLPPNTIPG